ncbi:MAG: GAF domain-containing protein [Nitrospinae bacterium]|nr:GAF domain-containing protein [Nitrospinota bacterium]
MISGERAGQLAGGLERISLHALDLEKILADIVPAACEAVGADACVVLLLDEGDQTMSLAASRGFNLEATNALRLPRDKGVSWRVVREKRVITLPRAREDPEFYNVPESGEDRYQSYLGAPLMDSDGCVGMIFVQTVVPREYSEEDKQALRLIAEKVAGAVRAAVYIKRTREKVNVLSVLSEMGRFMRETDDPAQIVRAAARHAAMLTGARSQIVWLAGEDGQPAPHHSPDSVGDEEYLRPVRLGVVSEAMREKTMIRVDDIRSQDRFPNLNRVAALSLACQPLVYKDRTLGAILVTDRMPPQSGGGLCAPFAAEELSALAEIASITAQAIVSLSENEALERALEVNKKNARELSILLEVAVAMQQAMSLDDLLRVILSSVTAGQGLGFNRAVLFLANERTGYFHGMMGIGPDSGEEAARIWNKIGSNPTPRQGLLQWLLEQDHFEIKNSRFNELARSLRVPISGHNALARAVGQRAGVRVRGREDFMDDDFALAGRLGCDRFAVMPLIVRDNPQGALFVDNLYNSRPITSEEIDLLARFAHPAAWAIENVRLVERLSTATRELSSLQSRMAQVERLSALGEISAELAHEIRNPLVSIGGFARRLLTYVPSHRVESRYASRIVQEVERLEGILKSTLDVSRGISSGRRAEDVNTIVRNVFELYRRAMSENGVEGRLKTSSANPQAVIDASQIKQALINLTLNAIEAMSCARHGTRKIFSVTTDKEGAGAAVIIISDTGGGIPARDFNDIFSPFFTSKQGGTGLGLSLCKKIVRLHKGTMTIDNRLGDGVTFTITLPGAS